MTGLLKIRIADSAPVGPGRASRVDVTRVVEIYGGEEERRKKKKRVCLIDVQNPGRREGFRRVRLRDWEDGSKSCLEDRMEFDGELVVEVKATADRTVGTWMHFTRT